MDKLSNYLRTQPPAHATEARYRLRDLARARGFVATIINGKLNVCISGKYHVVETREQLDRLTKG